MPITTTKSYADFEGTFAEFIENFDSSILLECRKNTSKHVKINTKNLTDAWMRMRQAGYFDSETIPTNLKSLARDEAAATEKYGLVYTKLTCVLEEWKEPVAVEIKEKFMVIINKISAYIKRIFDCPKYAKDSTMQSEATKALTNISLSKMGISQADLIVSKMCEEETYNQWVKIANDDRSGILALDKNLERIVEDGLITEEEQTELLRLGKEFIRLVIAFVALARVTTMMDGKMAFVVGKYPLVKLGQMKELFACPNFVIA